MEYVYAALLLHEAGEEQNEDNITSVLEAAGLDVDESRVKALVAALEDVDIEDAVEQAAAAPAAAAGGGGAAEAAEDADAGGEDDAEGEEEAAEEAEGGDDAGGEEEDEDVSGEGLGDLFG